MASSPKKKAVGLLDAIDEPLPDVVASYSKSSFVKKEPEFGFGTGVRPPLSIPSNGPGPGAYPIKTTLGKVVESNIKSPCQFTLKSRTMFGDPYERATSKTAKNLPGPGQYDLTGKFLYGENPRKSGFPKAKPPRDKAALAPGPASYEPMHSMGKQLVSSKPNAPVVAFTKAKRDEPTAAQKLEVGPGEYGPFCAACEPQVDSRHPTCASIKFGLGYRKQDRAKHLDLSEPAPGPGSYILPGAIGTMTRGTPFRNSPAAKLSGRNKFGSPW